MEYFPRIHHIAAHQQHEFVTKMGDPSQFKQRTNYLPCGDLKTMNWNAILTSRLCPYSQRDFQQDVSHSSVLDQKRSLFLLTFTDHKEIGIESLNR